MLSSQSPSSSFFVILVIITKSSSSLWRYRVSYAMLIAWWPHDDDYSIHQHDHRHHHEIIVIIIVALVGCDVDSTVATHNLGLRAPPPHPDEPIWWCSLCNVCCCICIFITMICRPEVIVWSPVLHSSLDDLVMYGKVLLLEKLPKKTSGHKTKSIQETSPTSNFK